MTFHLSDKELHALVGRMGIEEKCQLLNGRGLWRSSINYRLNIPEVIMTDGTYGVRYSVSQIDNDGAGTTGLQQFLEIVNRRPAGSDEPQDGMGFGSSLPATCFPNGNALACSWDGDLAYEVGAALAAECHHLGVNLLLGPGINIRRTPLAGRAYEYFSEDPLLSGEFGAAIIRGLQENGVGASLKHFACNNSEIERTTMSSDVDERALREIYLAGFERAIVKGQPWTVMSSYNRLNGIQAAENRWLLTTVLREEWGYNGLVVSDWYAIKDRPASLRAGNDLDMPESQERQNTLLAAIKAGEVSIEQVDQSCLRMLQFIRKVKAGERRGYKCDFEANHALARRAAAESLVLLKNDAGTLPLEPERDKRILLVGPGAMRPIIQGSGSATTRPTRVDSPFDELRALLGTDVSVDHCQGVSGAEEEIATLRAEAVAAAQQADVVIVFANADVTEDGEGSDRVDLSLARGQDDLIRALAVTPARVVVVLSIPDAVEMPWIDQVDAVVAAFYAGQGMGYALASVLAGRINPSGKLTVSLPRRMEDIPGYHTYPGENGHHAYAESIFVGYRYYDLKKMEVAFPFGHGLSYTRFGYSNLSLSQPKIEPGQEIEVSLDITNEGGVFGSEIVQIYIRPYSPALHRPVRELKAFQKIALQPGESQRISFRLSTRDFQHYDPAIGRWVLRAASFDIEAAASSRDIRLVSNLTCVSETRGFRRIERETQPVILARNPAGLERFLKFLMSELGISRSEAETLFEYCKSSIVGIPETLNWFVGRDAVDEGRLMAVLEEINDMYADPLPETHGRLSPEIPAVS